MATANLPAITRIRPLRRDEGASKARHLRRHVSDFQRNFGQIPQLILRRNDMSKACLGQNVALYVLNLYLFHSFPFEEEVYLLALNMHTRLQVNLLVAVMNDRLLVHQSSGFHKKNTFFSSQFFFRGCLRART